MDPTVGASLVDLGYDRTFSLVNRNGGPVTAVRRPAGWRALEVDGHKVRVPAGLDLGATAKGVAADLAVTAAGAVSSAALVGLGGDLATVGERVWRVLVAESSGQDEEDSPGQAVDLVRGGLATSGTRARRWR